jgi:hypothetical protein
MDEGDAIQTILRFITLHLLVWRHYISLATYEKSVVTRLVSRMGESRAGIDYKRKSETDFG